VLLNAVLDDRLGAAAAAVWQLACLEHGTEPVANKSELTKRCVLRIGDAIAAGAPAWMKDVPGGQRTPLELWDSVARATKHRMSGRQLAGLCEGLRGQEQQKRERTEAKRQMLGLQASEALKQLHRLVLQSQEQHPISFPLQRLLHLLQLGSGDDAIAKVVAAKEDVARLPEAVLARGRAALQLASDVAQEAAALDKEEKEAAGQEAEPEEALSKHRATWTGQLIVQEHGAMALRWCWPQRPSPHPEALTDAAAAGDLRATYRYTGACESGGLYNCCSTILHTHGASLHGSSSVYAASTGRLSQWQSIRSCSCRAPPGVAVMCAVLHLPYARSGRQAVAMGRFLPPGLPSMWPDTPCCAIAPAGCARWVVAHGCCMKDEVRGIWRGTACLPLVQMDRQS
jgi:hypothetical protein